MMKSGPKKTITPLHSVELFCGIGGFRIACDALGIQTTWANDLSQLSCEVYRSAYGDTEIVEGDIRDVQNLIPKHDLLTAGFPCQPFSSAGKKQGIRDPRGTLFEDIVNILKSRSPRWFILENVKRLLSMESGDHFATILKSLSNLNYFVEWRLLNATSFGLPQNRQRIVIVGTAVDSYNDATISLATREDLSEVMLHDFSGLRDFNSWHIIKNHHKKFPTWGLCYKNRFYSRDLQRFSDSEKTNFLESILEDNPPEQFYMDDTTIERIKESVYTNKLVEGVRILYNQNGGARMGYTVFGTDGLAPALTASHSRHYERYKIESRFRRLTNIEYARLQGFPDNHCASTTIFNQYGLFGNAVPPPLAKWAIERLIMQQPLIMDSLEAPKNSQLSLNL